MLLNLVQLSSMKVNFLLLFTMLLFLSACRNANVLNLKHEIIKNPYGYAPLTAVVKLTGLDRQVFADIIVRKQTKDGITLKRQIVVKPNEKDALSLLPVIGLYPEYLNEVVIYLKEENGSLLDSLNLKIQTDSLPFKFAKLPKVEGSLGDNELIFTNLFNVKMESGKDMDVSQTSLALDAEGAIRWYGDFKGRSHSIVEVIDGQLFAGSGKGAYAGKMVAYNFLGEELHVFDFSKNGLYHNIHHDIKRGQNGNFFLTVNKKESSSMENYILEFAPDLLGNNIQIELDLEELLPNMDDFFIDLPYSYYSEKSDILHINGIYPYPDSKHLLVSSRNVGLVKVDIQTPAIKWLLFPHILKASAGSKQIKKEADIRAYLAQRLKLYNLDKQKNKRIPANGIVPFQDYSNFVFNYEEFLLRPIDQKGIELKDENVVIFGEQSPNFSYPYRQHSPILLKNNNIAIFDNGDMNKNKNNYSRAVEYKIVEDKDGYGGTVEQVWEYISSNKDFASVVSSIKEMPNGNRLINFGAIDFQPGSSSNTNNKILFVEVTPNSPAKEVFNMEFFLAPNSIAYRVDKINLSKIE